MAMSRPRLTRHILLMLAAIPVAVWFGFFLLPPGEERFVIVSTILVLVFVPSLGLYFLWLYLRLRNPAGGLKLILLGTLFRLTLLLAVGLWLRIEHPNLERAGLLFYLITSGCFLSFELVAIIGFRIGFKPEALEQGTNQRVEERNRTISIEK